MTSEEELLQSFKEATGVEDDATARFFVEASGNNLEFAVQTYFEEQAQQPSAPAPATPAVSQSTEEIQARALPQNVNLSGHAETGACKIIQTRPNFGGLNASYHGLCFKLRAKSVALQIEKIIVPICKRVIPPTGKGFSIHIAERDLPYVCEEKVDLKTFTLVQDYPSTIQQLDEEAQKVFDTVNHEYKACLFSFAPPILIKPDITYSVVFYNPDDNCAIYYMDPSKLGYVEDDLLQVKKGFYLEASFAIEQEREVCARVYYSVAKVSIFKPAKQYNAYRDVLCLTQE